MDERQANHGTSTWQQTLRRGLLAFEAAVIAALVLLRATGTNLPFRGVFLIILVLAVTPTLLWWSWVDQRLAATPSRSHRRTWLRVLLAGYCLAMLAPLLLFRWGVRHVLPPPLLAWVMVWHLLLMVLGLIVLVGWLVHLAARPLRVRAGRRPAASQESPPTDAPADPVLPAGLTRRSFLASTLAVAPVVLAGTATAASIGRQGRFHVRRIRMHLPRLPDRLRGLTITQVSDIHVGRLFRPEHLGGLVDAVNRLDSDLLAITGDAVDHSIDCLPPVCDAFAQMRSRHGRFFVIGNHDLIDSPRQAVAYLRSREPNFLEDECRMLEIGGERLQVAGLFWSRNQQGSRSAPGYVERARQTMVRTDPQVFTVALTHHPHAFDTLADGGADLTLAGHTHGGQIMLTPPGAAQPIGGGSLLFRYIWGEYWRAGRALYVTSGAGNWFPLRINAPAEIVQIQLT